MRSYFLRFQAQLSLISFFSCLLLLNACTEENPEVPFATEASISTSVSTVTEGGNSPEITIGIDVDNTSGGALTLRYSLNGTATSGTDYSGTNGSVTIADGDSEATFTLTITDDEAVEENETITITLDISGQPEGVSIGDNNSISITIQDNDEEAQRPNTLAISASNTEVTEGANNPEITFQLSEALTSATSFDYRISGTAENGTDYTSLNGSITISEEAQSATLTIEITDDDEVESVETIVLTLNGMALPSGFVLGDSREITITIEDNDEETILVNLATISNGTEGGDNPSFEINTSLAVSEATTFTYTLSGSSTTDADYVNPSGEVTIEANTDATTFELELIDDESDEEEETIIISLSESDLPEGFDVGENTSATATITDNDEPTTTPITLTFDSSDGNSITIDSWTEVGDANGYIILINDENDFSNLTDGASIATSTTYVGAGLQAIFDAQIPETFTVTLLQDQTNYYFKVVPYSIDNTYNNNQDTFEASTMSCSADSETESELCLTIFEDNDTRNIVSNQYPNHQTGRFPNADVTATSLEVDLDFTPTNTGEIILVYNESGAPTPSNRTFYRFGVASNGLGYNPMGLKPWTNPETGEENWEWQAAVVNEGDTDMDEYGGHVTSQGTYHYHGDIVGLAANEDGSKHSLLYGWAADGFPIYYKYGYATSDNPDSGIKELTSSYQLKSGDRGGDGNSAPDGAHDGTYIQDYEYIAGLGDLDACNGRTGVTPEYPNGTYYYVITTDFPKVPNCFVGTPSDDFLIGN